MTSDPLTPSELAALPDLTRITVIWSGGNGPHEYELVRVCGAPYANVIGEDCIVGSLERIGSSVRDDRTWVIR